MTPPVDALPPLPDGINPATTTAICCAGSHALCPAKVYAWPPIEGEELIDCQCPCHHDGGTGP